MYKNPIPARIRDIPATAFEAFQRAVLTGHNNPDLLVSLVFWGQLLRKVVANQKMGGDRQAPSGQRIFSPQFKFDAVIETLSGEKTVAQICRKRNIDQALLSCWKQEFLARGPAIFESGAAREADQKDSRVAELERLVGRLTLEREILKRTAGLAVSSRRRNR